ncbi:MAG: serine/threonine-protein kinase [Planctomycetota bacterium]
MSEERPSDEGVGSDSSALDAEMIGAARREVEGADKPEGPNGLTLSTPGSAQAFTIPPSDSFTGYKIIREIHRGGQGVVYQAIQESTKRKVAIKVMKEGPFAGSSDRARFDREVHVLGQLNHPNIVAIHDTGSAAGSFFFVMDYISGQPLDVYMASGKRSIEETLRLFGEICEAVNAAHLRGIIHRDLKPGNIRVDAEGKPHVLDFGLAKVATTEAAASAMTMTGQFIGSLPWASPEQAEGAPGKIDVRTDVYSLGVVLYQMLTSKFPYDVIGNMRDVLDRIMCAEPARPRTIRRQINDEVETIALKCLSKERERRYQTAGELARDIKHYLNGEPIEAKRDSFGYMLRKQLKRYKLPAAVAAGFVLLLAVGLVVSSALYVQADQAREAEAEQRAQAVAAEEDTARVNDFYEQVLGAANPFVFGQAQIQKPMADVTVSELLEEAAGRAEAHFAGKPLLEARVRIVLARSFLLLERFKEAAAQARRALELRRQVLADDSPDTLAAMDMLGACITRGGGNGEGFELLRTVLEARRRVLGPLHSDTLNSAVGLGGQLTMRGRYAEAEEVLRTVVAERESIPADLLEHVGRAMATLACAVNFQGRAVEAEATAREALQIAEATGGPESFSAAWARYQVAEALVSQTRYAEAGPLMRQALEAYQRLFGDEGRFALTVKGSLAWIHLESGDLDEAEVLLRDVYEARRRLFGSQAEGTLYAAHALARLSNARERFGEAERLAREAVEFWRSSGAGDSHGPLYAKHELSVALRGLGRVDEAERIAREIVTSAHDLVSGGFTSEPYLRAHHGRCLTELGRYAEAEEQLLRARRRGLPVWTEGDQDHAYVIGHLVHLYEAWGKRDQAAAWRAQLPTTQQAPTSNPAPASRSTGPEDAL